MNGGRRQTTLYKAIGAPSAPASGLVGQGASIRLMTYVPGRRKRADGALRKNTKEYITSIVGYLPSAMPGKIRGPIFTTRANGVGRVGEVKGDGVLP